MILKGEKNFPVFRSHRTNFLTSECFEDKERNQEPRNSSGGVYIWDTWRIASFSISLLCALGSILVFFYVSVLYTYCTCRVRLSSKGRIIWDHWLACGLWIKWFLFNVRLDKKKRLCRWFTSHIWRCHTHRRTHKTNTQRHRTSLFMCRVVLQLFLLPITNNISSAANHPCQERSLRLSHVFFTDKKNNQSPLGFEWSTAV